MLELAPQQSRQQRRHKARQGYLMPAEGAEDSKFEQHFKVRCKHDSAFRIERMREWQVARAMILGKHWLELNTRDKNQASAFRYVTPNPKLKFPRPVTNEVYPIYDNEVSKQARRRSASYVRPVALQEGTAGESGTTVANDILEWHLETIGWSRKRKHVCRKEVSYGTAWLWSYLDQSHLHTIKVGLTEARRCVQCDVSLASNKLPKESELEGMGMSMYLDPEIAERKTYMNPEDGSPVHEYTARGCPACGGELEEYSPEDPEDMDTFNRPLGQDVPINQPDIDICGGWEIFLDNDGLGMEEPNDLQEIYRVTPERIDTWVAEHYPWAVDEVHPDSAERIADFFPFLGEYEFGNAGGGAADDRNLFQNHVLVYRAVIKPKMGSQLGRYVVFAGGVLLQDEPLLRKSTHDESVLIPLVNCTFTRFFVRDSEIDGQGIVTPIVSPQNRINMTYAQIIDVRQRNSVNGILATDGTQFTSGWLDGFNGRFLKYRPNPMYPNQPPQFLETRTIDQGVYQELDRTQDRMQWISGTQDVDVGKAPRNVSAATAIQMLVEQANGRRFTREEELIDAFREVYSHQLLLLSEFAREPRKYRAKNASGKWEYRLFKGLDLAGHTDVVVEEQSGYDARAYERESVLQAIQLKILTVSSPYAKREALKALGIPLKVNDEESTQVTDAESKFYQFRDMNEIPFPDASIDAHDLMYGIYGRFLKTGEMQKRARDNGWYEILPVIAGWEDKFVQANMLDTQIRAILEAAEQPPMGIEDPAFAAQIVLQKFAERGMDPQQFLLPAETTAKILTVWQRMGVPPEAFQQPYVIFRAVVEAHRVLGEQKMARAQMGPTFAPPAAPATPMGTVPVAGSMPEPGSRQLSAPEQSMAESNAMQG